MAICEIEKRNVLFCVLQDAKQERNDINEALYDAQNMLKKISDEGADVEKAFVYGNKYNHIKLFGEIPVEQISFIRYSIEDYSLVDSVLSGMNLLLEKQQKDRELGIDSGNSIVFLTNIKEIAPIYDLCLKKLFSYFKNFDVHPIFIGGNDTNCPAITNFTKERNLNFAAGRNGGIYTVDQFKYRISQVRDWEEL